MKRPVTKERATFSINKELLKELTSFCQKTGTSKSMFVEMLIRESLNSADQLFKSDDTLASAMVLLSKQLDQVKEIMASPDYEEYKNNLERLKGEQLSKNAHTK